jgi:hypothetical protein
MKVGIAIDAKDILMRRTSVATDSGSFWHCPTSRNFFCHRKKFKKNKKKSQMSEFAQLSADSGSGSAAFPSTKSEN